MNEPVEAQAVQTTHAGPSRGEPSLLPTKGQGTSIAQQAMRSYAEVRMAVESARAYPRSEELAREAILRASARPGFAEESQWAYTRGKKKNEQGEWVDNVLSGPSVYLAREMARCWGNLDTGFLILEDDGQSVHGESFARDLQTNYHVRKQWKVAKLQQRKQWEKGRPKLDAEGNQVVSWVVPDERDLLELVNRAAAKAVRNAIFEVLPEDLKQEALAACDETLTRFAQGLIDRQGKETQKGAAADGRCASAAVDRLCGEFRRLQPSVSIEMLERKLGHAIDSLSPEEYKTLAKVGASIKQGGQTVAEAFPEPQAAGSATAEQPAQEVAQPDDDPFAQPRTLDDVVRQKGGQQA